MIESKAMTNPFPGLRPFEIDEHQLFFGREGQADAMIARLKDSRFLAVVGTSGSGKSSLVRAGLLPALQGGMMAEAGSGWRIAMMRPGNDPIGNLARALVETTALTEAEEGLPREEAEAVTEAMLRRGSLGLIDVVQQARFNKQEKLLVLVDQFEELFRFRVARSSVGTEDDAAAFVKLLLEASGQTELAIYVISTMRSDFLGECSQFQGLPEAINDGQYLIPRMTRDERRFAITGPIGVRRRKITEPLINRLMNDVGDNPDQLPILQHALMLTWDYWSGHRLNGEPIGLEHYEAIGTMSKALSRHADKAFAELENDRDRMIAERLFKCLTEKGADNREIRRPTRLADICAIAEATEPEVVAVIDVFRRPGRSFLMPPANVELNGESVIDISHESLIRNWTRLQTWVDEEAQSARMYGRLADDALLRHEGKSGLLTDPRLQLTLDWRDEQNPSVSWAVPYHNQFELAEVFPDVETPAERHARLFDLAMSYLDESRDARDARIKDEQRLAQEEADRERRELEIKAALAENELRLAETERERAKDQAAAQRRELEVAQAFVAAQTRANRKLRLLMVALIVLVLLSMGTAAFAFTSWRSAQATELKALTKEKEIAELLKSEQKEKERARKAEIAAEADKQTALKAEIVAKEQATLAATRLTEAEAAKKRAVEAEEDARRELNAKNTEIQNDIRNREAFALVQSGDMKKAEESFKKLEERYKKDETRLPFVLTNRGIAQHAIGDKAAEDSFKRALNLQEELIRQKRLDAKDAGVLTALTGLAQFYTDERKYKEAREQYQKILRIREQILGNDNPGLADDIENLARSSEKAWTSGVIDLENAETLYLRALQLRRKRGNIPQLIDSLNNLARFYVNLQDDKQAKPLYEEVARIQEKRLEFDDLELTLAYENLALLYGEQGPRYKHRAEQLLKVIQTIKKRKRTTRDEEGTSAAADLDDLKDQYAGAGRISMALEVALNESRVLQEAGERQRPELLTDMGNYARTLKQYQRAKGYYQRELKLVGSNDDDAAEAHAALAALANDAKDYAASEAHLREALKLLQNNTRPRMSSLLNLKDVLIDLADALRAQGKHNEALGMYRQALAACPTCRAKSLETQEAVRKAERDVAEIIAATEPGADNREGLAITRDRLERATASRKSSTHFELSEARAQLALAEVYRQAGKTPESDDFFRAARISMNQIDPDNIAGEPKLIGPYLNFATALGRFYMDRGDMTEAFQVFSKAQNKKLEEIAPNREFLGFLEEYMRTHWQQGSIEARRSLELMNDLRAERDELERSVKP